MGILAGIPSFVATESTSSKPLLFDTYCDAESYLIRECEVSIAGTGFLILLGAVFGLLIGTVVAHRFVSQRAETEEKAAADPDIPAVRLSAISKSFGAIVACDRVDLTLWRGRIHGILGENGAGKSTLMKVLIGLVLPDGGTIEVDGERCQIRDPHDAATRGIGMVHQHFSLVEPLTVWENVMLGDTGPFDAAAAPPPGVAEISERYGWVWTLTPGSAICRPGSGSAWRSSSACAGIPASSSSTSPPRCSRRLSPSGCSRFCAKPCRRRTGPWRWSATSSTRSSMPPDEVTIMRAGAVVKRMETAEADAPILAQAMVGREVSLRSEASALGLVTELAAAGGDGEMLEATRAEHDARTPVLRLRDVVARGPDGRISLDGLSLDVFGNEIVGVAGVEGNGQAALTELLSSLLDAEAGTVEVEGTKVEPKKPGAMAGAGIAVIPEDRHASGCVLDMTVAENLFLVDAGPDRQGGGPTTRPGCGGRRPSS